LRALVCPDGKSTLPDGALACVTCLARKAGRIAADSQARHVPYVLARRLALLYRRRHRNEGELHLALFGFHQGAYCGENLENYRPVFEEYLAVNGELREGLCERCAARFRALVNQTHAAAARTE